MLHLRDMPKVHEDEDAQGQGAPTPEALAQAERDVRDACVRARWCTDGGMGSHDPACPADTLARELIREGVWEFAMPCGHGSHHWCYPCGAEWSSEDYRTRCARCGSMLGNTYVGDGDGTHWHIDCAPIAMIMDIDGDHHP